MLDRKLILVFIFLGIAGCAVGTRQPIAEKRILENHGGLSSSAGAPEEGALSVLPTDSQLTIFGVTVGKSKLTDVKAAKPANVYREGDAGDSLSGVCILGRDGSIIAFESGEMGGKEETILSIKLFRSRADYRFSTNCVKSREFSMAETFGDGVGLKSNRADVIAKRGKPSEESSNILLYSYRQSGAVADGRKTDALASAEFTFSMKEMNTVSVTKVVEFY